MVFQDTPLSLAVSQSRQLAAIMFTDIVGYTALMGTDIQTKDLGEVQLKNVAYNRYEYMLPRAMIFPRANYVQIKEPLTNYIGKWLSLNAPPLGLEPRTY